MAKQDKGLILTAKEAEKIKTAAQSLVDLVDEAFGEVEHAPKKRAKRRTKAEMELAANATAPVEYVAATPKATALKVKPAGKIKQAAQHDDNHAGLPLMPQ